MQCFDNLRVSNHSGLVVQWCLMFLFSVSSLYTIHSVKTHTSINYTIPWDLPTCLTWVQLWICEAVIPFLVVAIPNWLWVQVMTCSGLGPKHEAVITKLKQWHSCTTSSTIVSTLPLYALILHVVLDLLIVKCYQFTYSCFMDHFLHFTCPEYRGVFISGVRNSKCSISKLM